MNARVAPTSTAVGYGLVLVAAFVLPFLASNFVIQNVMAVAAWQGIVALSLVFLSKYGGMVSLAQVAIYGIGSYTLTILGVVHHLPWYVTVLAALGASTLTALIFGLLCSRSYGIYFLMVTLLLGLVVYYLAASNETITNGSTGISGIYPPNIGNISLTAPVPEYALDMSIAVVVLFGLTALMRTQFGLALQGCRDNPRKMRAIGYTVEWYRVLAFTTAGFVAGIGGVLGAWHNGLVAPGTLNLTTIIGFLVIAVIGGINSMPGVFAGALLYELITTYASSLTSRYNSVIGAVFLAVVLFAPDGLAGLTIKVRKRAQRVPHVVGVPGEPDPVDMRVMEDSSWP